MLDLVLEKAQSQLTVANNEETSSKEESLFVYSASQQIINNLEERLEGDLETQFKGNDNSEIHRKLDNNDDGLTDSDVEVDNATAARTFMQTLATSSRLRSVSRGGAVRVRQLRPYEMNVQGRYSIRRIGREHKRRNN